MVCQRVEGKRRPCGRAIPGEYDKHAGAEQEQDPAGAPDDPAPSDESFGFAPGPAPPAPSPMKDEAKKNGWVKEWMNSGGKGHLLRIIGDERTVDARGYRMEMLAWVSKDLPDLSMDFGIEYAEVMDDLLPDANLEVVETVLDMKQEQASFADRKEKMQ